MARILSGKEVVEALNQRIAADVADLKARGIEPTLAIMRVGERGDQISYERGASKRAANLDVAVRNVQLPADAGQDDIIAAVKDLNADNDVHGVLLLRPLLQGIDEELVRNTLAPQKDVDGITDISLVSTFIDRPTGYVPCTPQSCIEILDYYGVELSGKNVVVVGRSLVVGKPLAMMLLARNATVTIAHSRTTELPELVKRADIVIACVGRAKMLDASYLAPGQTVIDVGINVLEDGSLAGDVDFAAAENSVEAITPVPGGVGTVTTTVLVKHVVEAAGR
jgi:methylenetetrahydrofolate dehydrogenase (NADP+)/methenyltetrahydrofolate cyclohydrolase